MLFQHVYFLTCFVAAFRCALRHTLTKTHTGTHLQAWCSIAANLILLAIITCFDFEMQIEHIKRDYRNYRFSDT